MAMTSSEGTLLVIKKRCIADYEWMQAVRVVPQRGPKESRKVRGRAYTSWAVYLTVQSNAK